MNKKLSTLVLLLVMALACVMPARSQVRFGIRGGITLNELKFDRNVIHSDNRVGYCGGLLLDLNIPVVGLGLEASVMYTHRDNRLTDHERVFKRDYIDIPVYARYRLALPAIKKVFVPMVFTGPDFSILFSENAPSNYKNRKTYLSWDVGAGADLFNRVRLTATYGIGISKALEYVDSDFNGDRVEGKDRYWTVCAAILF
ncbi:MAG: PorT family protein [Muribaculaceae bacterium]|jgi:hypothetical protein|nr:PorT family protein [Muribaculaceae bacterium]